MDEQQRELERQASTGDVEAETNLLLGRVRSGDLTEERLRLAAHLGHPPALLATGRASERRPIRRQALLLTWARGLEEWGKEACVRAAVTAALQAANWLRESTEHLEDPEDLDYLREGLRVALLSLTATGEIGTIELEEAVADLGDICLSVSQAPASTRGAVGAALWAVRSQIRLDWSDTIDPVRFNSSKVHQEALKDALCVLSPQDLHGWICDDLVPWALGTGDPIRDRVEARKPEATE